MKIENELVVVFTPSLVPGGPKSFVEVTRLMLVPATIYVGDEMFTSEIVGVHGRITIIGNRLYRVDPLDKEEGVSVSSPGAVWQVTVAREHLV